MPTETDRDDRCASMTFRRNNKAPDRLWRKNHRDELPAVGLPDSVVDDERRWNYVLLHGDDEFHSGWSPTRITKEQAGRLLLLLQSQFQTHVGLDLFDALERRVKGAQDC